jgi:DNA-binding XRE family transcriptional regulator
VVVVECARPKADDAIDIDDLVTMLEAEPGGKEGMEDARRWLATTLQGEDAGTFKSLRLAAGLSQAALAEQVGLQQPNISAIEAGNRRPEYDTARKLAQALQVTIEEIYAAFDKNQKGKK